MKLGGKILGTTLISILFICGCIQIECGKVIDKEFIPSHTYVDTDWVNIGETTVPITTTKTKPDKWYITIEGWTDEKDSKCVRREVRVDESTYHKFNIGDFFDVRKDL